MSKEAFVMFREVPASRDEQKIAKVMRTYALALRVGNLPLLISLFSDNAIIDSQAAGGTVALPQYIAAITPLIREFRRVTLRDLVIRIHGLETATVFGTSQYTIGGKTGRVWNRAWKLAYEGGAWRITASYYHR